MELKSGSGRRMEQCKNWKFQLTSKQRIPSNILKELGKKPIVVDVYPNVFGPVAPDPDPSIIKQNIKKTKIPSAFWLLYDFLFFKTDVNVASKSNRQKNFEIFVLIAILKVTGKTAGSGSGVGSGSVSQRYGSADPDPCTNQNVTDPQHWLLIEHQSLIQYVF